jgi:hypothetical protein
MSAGRIMQRQEKRRGKRNPHLPASLLLHRYNLFAIGNVVIRISVIHPIVQLENLKETLVKRCEI